MLMDSLLKRPTCDQPRPQTNQDPTALDSSGLQEQNSAAVDLDKGFSVRSESPGDDL